jgi:hypothetical protein
LEGRGDSSIDSAHASESLAHDRSPPISLGLAWLTAGLLAW